MTPHVLNCDLQLFSERESASVSEVEYRDDVFVISLPLSRGNARLESNGRLLYDGDVQPGMMRVVSPGERVRLTRRTEGGGAVITVAGDWFRQLADAQRHRAGFDEFGLVRPVLEADRHVESLRSALLGVVDVDPAQRPLYVEGIALTLLSLVLNRKSKGERRAVPNGANGGLSDRELARCVDYADSRIGTHLDLDTWASVLDMPTVEFVRRFRRTTQSAPYAWFLRWRIDRAKQLMIDPERSLVEIALEVGFSSQSHFTEAFRRRVGVSPARWRRRLHEAS
jgi:AraC family transcriptional regulator